MNTFSVKNFERFQHYKDRSPPWIKLYNELLDDYEFGRLQDASKMHLIGIWLLASRSDNVLPYDADWIAKRINATAKVNLTVLSEAGFIVIHQALQTPEQNASSVLADRKQSACLERETEREAEKNVPARHPKRRFDPSWQPSDADRAFAGERGLDADELVGEFRDYQVREDRTSADWSANWRTWCRQAVRFRDQGTGRSGRMVHRQGPNSLIAAARAVAAEIEGQQ